MPVFSSVADQLGRVVEVPQHPKRIISLVPSQTELLFDLGVGARVVGITKFCIHPEKARTAAAIIGGTKQFDFAKIRQLRPDLIIGNKEENYQAGIAQLAVDYPVWLSDIATLPDALAMIREVGNLVQAPAAAAALEHEIGGQFQQIAAAQAPGNPGLRVLYLIWRRPWMGAGSGTFIHEMLGAAGWQNALKDTPRYPELTAEHIAQLAPDVLLLSSEPYPFQPKHMAELQVLAPQARLALVDGELFSWYGSRLRHTAAYLTALQKAF